MFSSFLSFILRVPLSDVALVSREATSTLVFSDKPPNYETVSKLSSVLKNAINPCDNFVTTPFPLNVRGGGTIFIFYHFAAR